MVTSVCGPKRSPSEKVRGQDALGHEQDIYGGWTYPVSDMLSIGVLVGYIFYPFSDEDLTGSKNPSGLDAGLTMTVSPWLDITVDLSYFAGLSGQALKDASHVYIRPSFAKTLLLSNHFSMKLGIGVGVKVYTVQAGMTDNMVDILFDWTLPIAVAGPLYIEPGMHIGWTNFDKVSATDPDTGETVTFGTPGDEFMVYGSVNVGADF